MGTFGEKYFNVGMEKGIEKGMENRTIEIAIKMLEEEESIAKIMRFTNLSEKQILRLKHF